MPVKADMPAVRVPSITPRGKLGLVVVAVAVLPLLWTELKKQGKKLADQRDQKNGEKPKEANEPSASKAEPPTQTADATAAGKVKSKPGVKSDATTKKGKTAAGTRITTASPTGHEEMSEASAAESAGSGTPPKRATPKRKPAAKAPAPDQPKNPKRSRSRGD